MKILKHYKGFNPIIYKGISFPQKCVKGCPVVTTANLYKLVGDGLIARLLAKDVSDYEGSKFAIDF